jgi:hypothetical protein
MDQANKKVMSGAGGTREFRPEQILKYFKYDHLPPFLQAVSKPFCDLAHSIAGETTHGHQGVCDVLPPGPERTVALRKLLEAKDAAVRTLV